MKLIRRLFGLDDTVKPAPHTVHVFFGVNNWHWHEKAANGEITCHTEGFDTRYNAERAAKAHVAATRVLVD